MEWIRGLTMVMVTRGDEERREEQSHQVSQMCLACPATKKFVIFEGFSV
jgi:hypothetical protein